MFVPRSPCPPRQFVRLHDLHVYILRHADKTNIEVAEIVRCHPRFVFNVHKAFVTQGLGAALHREALRRTANPPETGWCWRSPAHPACSKPPKGRSRWTLQLLADRLVELQIFDSISIKTVEWTAKKRAPATYKKRWVIPPTENGNFVAAMKDMLEVYQRPHDPAHPMICMDEQPIQLHTEVRETISVQPSRPERHDYEYRRSGVACGFMFTEPSGKWRRITISETRTKNDWALQVKHLLEVDYLDAEKVILVCDSLNTHTPAAFYDISPHETAKNLMSRLEIYHTPKHGNWLNTAETELSVLTRQCLERRIPMLKALRAETDFWSQNRNQAQKGAKWQFTTSDTRRKLKRLYLIILEY